MILGLLLFSLAFGQETSKLPSVLKQELVALESEIETLTTETNTLSAEIQKLEAERNAADPWNLVARLTQPGNRGMEETWFKNELEKYRNTYDSKNARSWGKCLEKETRKDRHDFQRCDDELANLEIHFKDRALELTAFATLVYKEGDGEITKRKTALDVKDKELKTKKEVLLQKKTLHEKKTLEVPLKIKAIDKAEHGCNSEMKTIDFTAKGGSMENTKLQNQARLSTCYANAMSVLYEAALGQPISYLDLALRYKAWDAKNDNEAFTSLDFGVPSYLVSQMKDQGVCPAENSWLETGIAPNGEEINPHDRSRLIQFLINFLESKTQLSWQELEVLKEALAQYSPTKPIAPKKYKAMLDSVECDSDFNSTLNNWTFLLSQITELNKLAALEMQKLDPSEQNWEFLKYFQAMLISGCKDPKDRIDVSHLVAVDYNVGGNPGTNAHTEEMRYQILDGMKNGQPLQLSICGEIILSPSWDRSASCAPHAVAIAGYRFNPETKNCQLRVWDSSGFSSKEEWIDEQLVSKGYIDMLGLENTKTKK